MIVKIFTDDEIFAGSVEIPTGTRIGVQVLIGSNITLNQQLQTVQEVVEKHHDAMKDQGGDQCTSKQSRQS